MRQSIEKRRETMSDRLGVAVFLHGRAARSAFDGSFPARKVAAQSLSALLKVTVKKWEAMRQSIDLNGKKECRGEAVTVMVNGSFVRFCDSNSFALHSARLLESSVRTDVSAGHSSKVAVMQHPKPRAELFAHDLIGQSRLTVGKLDKNFSQACYAQSAAFQFEGASSSGCANAALNLTTQKSEQRRCAAA